MMATVLALDFGASSGRAIRCAFDGERLSLEEVHRFVNEPVIKDGTLYWNLNMLFGEVLTGIQKAQQAGGFQSIGVDTWGVDFGLVGKNGALLEAPVHYRDKRTSGLSDEVANLLGEWELYEMTGIQRMDINTLFQQYALQKQRPELLKKADCLLLMPNLFDYLLTGERHAELSIASTTQMLDIKNHAWNAALLARLGLSASLLPPLIQPGTQAGVLKPELCQKLGMLSVPVIAVASHDTASAVMAAPAEEKKFIFISCGTWSLVGAELTQPVITAQSQTCNLTNELGFGGKVTFLKNIIGLWLIQETRRQFQREGKQFTFAQMEQMARESRPFACFIDPDAPEFVPAGDISSRVRAFCEQTGQAVPQSDGEVIRCIYESLALKYRYAIEQIKACTGDDYEVIHLVGGGTKDILLCQMTADATNIPVTAGPVEATAMGNAAAQLMALGCMRDLSQVRAVIGNSCSPHYYRPMEPGKWASAYDKTKYIFEKN
jgi:rhamnulokinase